MAQQVAKIKLTKLVAKNHLTALEKNQLTLTPQDNEKKIMRIKTIILGILIINMLTILILIIMRGQSDLLLSFKGIMAILRKSEEMKLAGLQTNDISTFSKTIGILFYFCTILYGYSYEHPAIGKSFLLKVLIIVNIAGGVIISALKFNIISCIVLFSSGYITATMKDGKLRLSKIKYKKLFLYAIVIGTVLLFLMNNRAGINVGLKGFMAYGFGEIPSFNYWYIDGLHENTYGVQSFYGIVSHLIPGIPFAEGYSNYPLAPCAPIVNIFTMFRAIVSDFGSFGGLFLFLLMGISAGVCNRNLQTSGFANGWMALLLGALFMGFLMPLGYYLSLLLAYILFTIFMCISKLQMIQCL